MASNIASTEYGTMFQRKAQVMLLYLNIASSVTLSLMHYSCFLFFLMYDSKVQFQEEYSMP